MLAEGVGDGGVKTGDMMMINAGERGMCYERGVNKDTCNNNLLIAVLLCHSLSLNYQCSYL